SRVRCSSFGALDLPDVSQSNVGPACSDAPRVGAKKVDPSVPAASNDQPARCSALRMALSLFGSPDPVPGSKRNKGEARIEQRLFLFLPSRISYWTRWVILITLPGLD